MFQPVFLVCLKTTLCFLSPFPLNIQTEMPRLKWTQSSLFSFFFSHFSMKHSVLSSGEKENNNFKISFTDIILWENWHRFMYQLVMAQLGSLSVQGDTSQKAFFIFWMSTNQTWKSVEVKEAGHWYIDKFYSMLFLGPENDRLRKRHSF